MSMVQTHQFPMKYDELSLESMHHRIEENFLNSTPWSYIVILKNVCRSKEIRRSQCVDSPEKSPRNPSGPIPIPALQPSLSPSHAPVWDGRPPPEPFLCPGRSNPGLGMARWFSAKTGRNGRWFSWFSWFTWFLFGSSWFNDDLMGYNDDLMGFNGIQKTFPLSQSPAANLLTLLTFLHRLAHHRFSYTEATKLETWSRGRSEKNRKTFLRPSKCLTCFQRLYWFWGSDTSFDPKSLFRSAWKNTQIFWLYWTALFVGKKKCSDCSEWNDVHWQVFMDMLDMLDMYHLVMTNIVMENHHL